MTALAVQRLSNHALSEVDLTIEHGECFALMGPSGAGKSTLIHAIAGLVPYGGSVLLDGRPVDRLPSYKRRMGVVFQDLFLFPHLSVRSNLTIAMARLSLGKREERDRSSDLLTRFGLRRLADRRPDDLSGGERQRVALARAMASAPRLLLLDEPLSSLDADTATALRREIRCFQQKSRITTILVTHSREEAAELGDRIGVMEGGKLMS